ncbi:MAG TPA: LytTR family DNA-binding domain-containing protein [Bacteroidales bacterium]|nr:LytTR family DNA-binding domain-containing protein [Bacteroidales bacterium]
MTGFLKRPYRETGTAKEKIISILAFGLFIFLFLFLFRPFGLESLKTITLFVVTLGFGILTTFMIILFKYLIEPAVIKTETRSIGKNLMWDLLIASSIGGVNYIYIIIIFHIPFSFIYLLYSVWTAILVGFIPVTLTYMVSFNRMYRNRLRESSIEPEYWDDEVIIRAGNPKNGLRLNPKEIVYLCSNDNYVTVVTYNKGIRNKTTLRGTLKSAEDELKRNKRFVRCHKCYILNLDYAENVTGNNQNMKIRLKIKDSPVPVSRTRAKEISSLIR